MRTIIIVCALLAGCAGASNEPAPDCRWLEIAIEIPGAEGNPKACVTVQAPAGSAVRIAGTDGPGTEEIDVYAGMSAEVWMCAGDERVTVRECP